MLRAACRRVRPKDDDVRKLAVLGALDRHGKMAALLPEAQTRTVAHGLPHERCDLRGGEEGLPGAQAVRAAVEAGHIQARPDVGRSDADPDDGLTGLDAGELAAIHLALALRCPVLMDERRGRQVARRRGLTVIGSAEFLLGAKQRGLVPAVAPIRDQWRQSGYFLSDAVIKAVLERAGET